MNRITLYFLFLAANLNAQILHVIRGPYLQSPGTNSMIIHWRTDSATTSRVTYGLNFGSSAFNAANAADSTEHIVQLTGLTPLTKYYYTIGTNTQVLKGPDSLMYFTTAPTSTAATPLRLWATGCFGQGTTAQSLVRESYLNQIANTKPADLWLWLGDNAYDDGTDVEYQTKVFDSIYGYQRLFPNLPFASTSGNREYNSICPWQPNYCTQDPNLHTGPYLDIIDPPCHGELGGVASNLKIFYSFDYGDIHFVSLNSEIGSQTAAYDWLGISDLDTTFTSPMIEWLKADLSASTKKWKIAFWHQPPYSVHPLTTEYSPMSVAARGHFNPILEQYGVDLVLSAHDHSYQRSYLINGHYGLRPSFTSAMRINGTSGNDALGEAYVKYTDGALANKGTVYVIEGNSASNSSYTPVADPAIYKAQLCDTCIGSLFIDVDGNRLDAHFLSVYGGIVDQFTILKQSTTGINDIAESEVLQIYPNPANDKMFITYQAGSNNTLTKILVVDVTGKMVSQFSAGDKHSIEWNTQSVANGMYIVRVESGSLSAYKRVSVIH